MGGMVVRLGSIGKVVLLNKISMQNPKTASAKHGRVRSLRFNLTSQPTRGIAPTATNLFTRKSGCPNFVMSIADINTYLLCLYRDRC